jgi:hypothetical protein
VTRCDCDAKGRHGKGADGVRSDHQRFAAPVIGGDSGQQREEGERGEPGEADCAGLRRGPGDRQRQQRIRDGRQVRAGTRERLPQLQQHEVAVAAKQVHAR